MSKYKQESQVKADLTPTSGELDKLRAAMEGKKQERMNGKLQSRFRQVMYEWKVLTLMDNGEAAVRDPYQYTKWSDAEAMIEAADVKQEDRLFAANPELAAEAKERFHKFMRETRAAVFGVGKKMKV